ncbi:MAG: hypothetical protein IJU58_00795 [Clostridia bacterium]|nr:hypothetical protein [Clostridia bacterium]
MRDILQNILPPRFAQALRHINNNLISELRLRENKPAILWGSQKFFLTNDGVSCDERNALIPTTKELDDIVFNASEHSIYAHNDELCMGYLTLQNGIRLGIAGQVVVDKGVVKTVKNVSSINIRFAREIKNCSLNSLRYIADANHGICNTLVIAPPNGGKTTFIRDLCYQISNKNLANNVLLIDERNEISASVNGHATLNIGENTDVYCGCTKQFGIINGIRTMSPNIIVLDEISTAADVGALDYVVSTGVKIVATMHADNFESLTQKPLYQHFSKLQLFERFVVLERCGAMCQVAMIYNQAGVCLFCRG